MHSFLDNRIVFWVQTELSSVSFREDQTRCGPALLRARPPTLWRSASDLFRGASRGANDFGQANKSRRWMPWRQEAMKDVVSCEKLRGGAKQPVIRRCPNGETRRVVRRAIANGIHRFAKPTRGTETSQYPEERKSTETPPVAASERGLAQTGGKKFPPGLWDSNKGSGRIGEGPGKARRRG